jgi:hypothetical protein
VKSASCQAFSTALADRSPCSGVPIKITYLMTANLGSDMMYQVRLLFAAVVFAAVAFACGGNDSPAGPSSSDTEKFLGNWAGTYQCTNFPGDTLTIAKGSGDLDFLITLHAYTDALTPEVVDGELTDVNVITIPEQTIGGFPGHGTITYANNALSLSQTGLGITCRGSNYVKY